MWKRIFTIFAVLLLVGISGTAMAATYNDFVSDDKILAKSALEPVHDYVAFINYRQFNFGHANINGASGVTNGDVIRLFNVPPNTFIEEFGYRVTTAAVITGTSAIVGDGANTSGFVANTYTTNGVPFVDLSSAKNGVSRWNVYGPSTNGTTDFVLSGVSTTISIGGGTGGAAIYGVAMASNAGTYFTSGISPYIGGDTIDMTVYVDKAFNPGTGKAGVTPVFEAYIKGFKRVVP